MSLPFPSNYLGHAIILLMSYTLCTIQRYTKFHKQRLIDKRGRIMRHTAGFCSLLKGIGKLDERWFAIRSPHEGNTNGQTENVTRGNADRRVASLSGRL